MGSEGKCAATPSIRNCLHVMLGAAVGGVHGDRQDICNALFEPQHPTAAAAVRWQVCGVGCSEAKTGVSFICVFDLLSHLAAAVVAFKTR